MDVSQNDENENETLDDERRQDEEAQKIRTIYRGIREQLNGNNMMLKLIIFK